MFLRCFRHGHLCRVEHILNENAVSRCRIIYENVRHGSNDLAVLDDRAATHALDDAACGGKELRVGDADREALRALGIVANLRDLDPVIGRRAVGQRGAQGRFASAKLARRSDGDCVGRVSAIDEITEHAAFGIGGNDPELIRAERSLQLSGLARSSSLDALEHHAKDGSAPGGDERAALGIANAVAKSAEGAGPWVNEGYGSDPGGAVADEDPKARNAVFSDIGRQSDVHDVVFASELQSEALISVAFEQCRQFLCPFEGGSVHFKDNIPDAHACTGGNALGFLLRQSDNEHPLGGEANAEGGSRGDQGCARLPAFVLLFGGALQKELRQAEVDLRAAYLGAYAKREGTCQKQHGR